MKISADVITGGLMSRDASAMTITSKLMVSDTFPTPSVAVHVTVVVPTGNSELEA